MHRKYTPEFEAFWQAYPLRIGKKKAGERFEQLLKVCVPAQLIIDGAERYAVWCAQDEQNWYKPKHALTWLNGDHWEDEYPMPASRASGWAEQRKDLPDKLRLAVDNG